jgi:hypothetical protein
LYLQRSTGRSTSAGHREDRRAVSDAKASQGAHRKSQRVGKIDIAKPFDAVLLVLMDEKLNATAIYEAPRKKVIEAPHRPRL